MAPIPMPGGGRGRGASMRNREGSSPPGSSSGGNGSSKSPRRKSSTSPSGSPQSSRRSGSGGGSSSPRDLSPPLLQELANMNIRELATRPDRGTKGRPIDLATNFFEMRLKDPSQMVQQYHIEVSHPSPNRKLDRDECRQIFWKIVDDNKDMFPNKYTLAFDGNHILFTPRRIQFPEEKTSMKLQGEVGLARDSRESTTCEVSFQFVGPVLMDVSKARTGNLDDRMLLPIQIIDVIVRQGLTCPLLDYAKGFYAFKSSVYKIPSPGACPSLGAGMELWSGFYSSAHITGSGDEQLMPLLNIDVSNTAFYKAKMTMLEFMCEILNDKAMGSSGMGGGGRGRGGPPMRGGRGGGRGGGSDGPYQVAMMNNSTTLTQHEWKSVADSVKGLKVRISHRPNAVRVYKVNSLQAAADELQFNVNGDDGAERRLTVAQYFAERYGELQYPKLPCLHVGPPMRHIYFPIEVCDVDYPAKVAKKLNEQQTSTVIRSSAIDAERRAAKIMELARSANYDKDPFLKEFGLQVSSRMMEVRGRVLEPPKIQYGKGPRNANGVLTPRDGAWDRDMPNQVLLEPATCRGYSLIALVAQKDQNACQGFCDSLYRKAIEMGLKWPNWPDCVKFGRNREDVTRLYKEILEEYKRNEAQCDLIFVIMPGKNADIYISVKECSDLIEGVMSQCLLLKTISRPGANTLANIILKLNSKLGGINWHNIPDPTASKFLTGVPTLVLGVDVTHPTAMEERQGVPSIATVVGNLDNWPMKYGSNVKVQKKTRESVVYLLDAVRERLVHFYKVTQQKPSRIIVYRDGVSEGQFMEVLREEMQGIRTACLMLSGEYRPPITYIVVQKRHHARLFPRNPRDAVGKAKNVPPGTVLDTGVLSPQGFDFYLCSHFGIQGTSRPSRYHVLWDDNQMTSDEIQSLTYQLCHTYVRCARTVSIPAPVYYAHLVCARARCHIKKKLGMDSDSASQDRMKRAPSKSGASTTGTETETESEAGGAVGGSGSSSSSDSALQDCVQVVDKFKGRMYFV